METTRHSRSLSVVMAALVLDGCVTPFGCRETADDTGEEGDGQPLATEGADRG